MKDALVFGLAAALGGYVGAIVTGYDNSTAVRTSIACGVLTVAIIAVIKRMGR